MKLLINDIDVTNKVEIIETVYEDFTDGKINRLFLKFSDSDRNWQYWSLKENDTIEIKEDKFSTGTLYCHIIGFDDGNCYLVAKAIPYTNLNVLCETLNNTNLKVLAYQLADEIGFDVSYHLSDRKYEKLILKNQTRLDKLKQLVKYESVLMVLFNKQIHLFNAADLETANPSETFVLSSNDVFVNSVLTRKPYNSAKIISNNIIGAYHIDEGSGNINVNDYVSSIEEANRFAKGILRNANENLNSYSIKTNLNLKYMAGSVIGIENSKLKNNDGNYFVYASRHDFLNEKTKLFIRKAIDY